MRVAATARPGRRFPPAPGWLTALNLKEWLRLEEPGGRIRFIAKADGREQVGRSGRRDRLLPIRQLAALLPPHSSLPAARAACRALGVDWQAQLARGLTPVDEPRRLLSPGLDHYGRRLWLEPAACRAWWQLKCAAQREGVALAAISGFRAVAWQQRLLARKLARGQTLAQILAVSAAPGFSEHHSGTALDLATPDDPHLEERFEKSDAFRWLDRRAAAFGFHLTLPRGNPYGYVYEPWHWRFRPPAALQQAVTVAHAKHTGFRG